MLYINSPLDYHELKGEDSSSGRQMTEDCDSMFESQKSLKFLSEVAFENAILHDDDDKGKFRLHVCIDNIIINIELLSTTKSQFSSYYIIL